MTARTSENFYRAFLCGYGALFFAPSPIAGVFFLAGTFLLSPVAGAVALVSLLVATGTAHVLRRPREQIESGLYGFNAAIASFALLTVALPADVLYVLVLVVSAASAVVMAWFIDSRWVTRWNLPSSSLPALLVAYPLIAGVVAWSGRHVSSDALPPAFLNATDLFRDDFYGPAMKKLVSLFGEAWPARMLFLIGAVVHSPRLGVLFLGGIGSGMLVGWCFLGWYGAFNPVYVLYGAAPTFVALGGYFTGHGWRSIVFGLLGVVASFFVWFHGSLLPRDLELPILTLPSWLTTVGFLALLRVLPAHRLRLLPVAIPLARADSPDAASRWARESEFGIRFWRGIGALRDEPWLKFARPAQMQRAQELLHRAQRIVVLTGAGVSTESGIPDYRSGAIVWKQYDTRHFQWEQFLASEESRRKYWEMSQDFFLVLRTAQPNAAHQAIAELERQGKLLAIVTQNVDRLHQAAGVPGPKVIELHGNEHVVGCLNCGRRFPREDVYQWIVNGVAVPHCPGCQGILKPDSIAFGQPMPAEECQRALDAVRGADLLLVVGTSLSVQPAASLPVLALRQGTRTILVNLEPTDFDPLADVVLRGPCGVMIRELTGRGSSTA